jgi:hypothetical protein
MMITRSRIGILCAAALASQTGCTTMAINMAAPTLGDVAGVGFRNTDTAFMGAALPGSLLQLEGFLELSPHNYDLLMLNAEGNCGYALGFLEDDEPARASTYYLKGRDLAFSALSEASSGFRKARAGGATVRDALADVDNSPETVRAMFWAGNCWGSWLNLNMANPRAYFAIPDVLAIMQKVAEFAPDYYWGGAQIFLAAFYAAAPPLAGGGLDKARPYFEAAFKASDRKFLMAQYQYARVYATMLKDQPDPADGRTGVEIFDAMIAEIAAADPAAIPDLGLANAVIQKKAQRLAAQREKLF